MMEDSSARGQPDTSLPLLRNLAPMHRYITIIYRPLIARGGMYQLRMTALHTEACQAYPLKMSSISKKLAFSSLPMIRKYKNKFESRSV